MGAPVIRGGWLSKEPHSPLLHPPALQVTLLEKLGQKSLVPHIPPLWVPDLGGWGWGMGHVGAGPTLPSTAAVNLRSETHGTGTCVVHSRLGRAREGGCSCDGGNVCHCPCGSQWPPRVAEHWKRCHFNLNRTLNRVASQPKQLGEWGSCQHPLQTPRRHGRPC